MPTDFPKTLMLVGTHHDDNEGNASTAILRHLSDRVAGGFGGDDQWAVGSQQLEKRAYCDVGWGVAAGGGSPGHGNGVQAI